MTLRSFAVLLVATVIAVAAAIVSSISREDSAIADRGKRLLPDLAANADDVAEITVTRTDGTTTLVKRDDGFVDGTGFPVKTDVVRDLLASLSVMTVVETKTDDPSRYGDLDLAEPTAEEGAGTEIVLSDKAGNEIVRVVAGRNDYTVGGRGGGQFVRTGDGGPSYLVRGSVELPLTRASWFDAVLLEQDPATIERVELTGQDGEAITFRREGDALTLVDAPAERDLDASKRDRLTGIFAKLDFVDVREAAASAAAARGILRAETDDGLAISIIALSPRGQRDQWARISVESLDGEADSATEELAGKVEDFEFRLPAGDLDVVDWTMDDFLVTPES